MQIFLILALVIAIIAVLFALQNVTIVTISFFIWNAQVSLAVALLIALGLGVIISALVSIPERVKSGWKSSRKNKNLSSLEMELENQKTRIELITAERDDYINKLHTSEKEVADLELKLANFAAALQETEEKLNLITPQSDVTPPETGPALENTRVEEEYTNEDEEIEEDEPDDLV
ncbi:MAG: LapA family protein [Leptolinea sp.]|nr:LapA family protein [Leptolinea sp.]